LGEARRLLARLRAALAARDAARTLLKGSGDRPLGAWALRRIAEAYGDARRHSWGRYDRPRFSPEALEGHVYNAEVQLEAETRRVRARSGGDGGEAGERGSAGEE
jgi:hypothetical protein